MRAISKSENALKTDPPYEICFAYHGGCISIWLTQAAWTSTVQKPHTNANEHRHLRRNFFWECGALREREIDRKKEGRRDRDGRESGEIASRRHYWPFYVQKWEAEVAATHKGNALDKDHSPKTGALPTTHTKHPFSLTREAMGVISKWKHSCSPTRWASRRTREDIKEHKRIKSVKKWRKEMSWS